jgi:hypothetical protein
VLVVCMDIKVAYLSIYSEICRKRVTRSRDPLELTAKWRCCQIYRFIDLRLVERLFIWRLSFALSIERRNV